MEKYLSMSNRFTGSVTIDYNGHICDDKSFFGSTDIAEDYYDHICHAINSHDELVAEVERLRDVAASAFIDGCYAGWDMSGEGFNNEHLPPNKSRIDVVSMFIDKLAEYRKSNLMS